MAIGSTIRRMFGRHEHRVSELYRGLFMDLDDYARHLREVIPSASRILEVGCGEGAVTEILAETFPDAEILAIDITPNVGRLYRGRTQGVTFRQTSIQEIAAAHPGAFDLVTLSDVLHHIPRDLRTGILGAVERAVAKDGRFLLKDWGRKLTPIHAVCYAGDRYLTGDRIAYLTPDEARELAGSAFDKLQFAGCGTIRPWSNNYTQLFA